MAATTVAEFGVGTACCAVAKSEVSNEVVTVEAATTAAQPEAKVNEMAATTVAAFGVGTACCAAAKSEASNEVVTVEAATLNCSPT